MAPELSRCPLCSLTPEDGLQARYDMMRDLWRVDCRRCATYVITEDCIHHFEHNKTDGLHFLSAASRIHNLKHNEPLVISMENYRKLIDPLAAMSVYDRMLAFLSHLVKMSPAFGHRIDVAVYLDYPLAYVDDRKAFEVALKYLRTEGLVEFETLGISCPLVVTVAGHRQNAENKHARAASTTAFVAMSFAPELDPIYEQGIKPAIEQAGYTPVRVDRGESLNKICDEIIAEIRRSRFVVADFTLQRQGVYFESGFALGLGLPVIWLCREGEEKDLHFDTRQYNHLLWKDPADLRKMLLNRIKANIV